MSNTDPACGPGIMCGPFFPARNISPAQELVRLVGGALSHKAHPTDGGTEADVFPYLQQLKPKIQIFQLLVI
jgi:hypothetical protein